MNRSAPWSEQPPRPVTGGAERSTHPPITSMTRWLRPLISDVTGKLRHADEFGQSWSPRARTVGLTLAAASSLR